MNDLNRNCLKSGHWVILHDTQFDTAQSLGQLGKGSVTRTSYTLMFHILQIIKKDTQAFKEKQCKQDEEKKTNWERNGTRELFILPFLTHIHSRVHYKSCTHKLRFLLVLLFFIRGKKILFRGTFSLLFANLFFHKKKVNGSTFFLNNCFTYFLFLCWFFFSISIIDFDDR
jgi:hypothetical protein